MTHQKHPIHTDGRSALVTLIDQKPVVSPTTAHPPDKVSPQHSTGVQNQASIGQSWTYNKANYPALRISRRVLRYERRFGLDRRLALKRIVIVGLVGDRRLGWLLKLLGLDLTLFDDEMGRDGQMRGKREEVSWKVGSGVI